MLKLRLSKACVLAAATLVACQSHPLETDGEALAPSALAQVAHDHCAHGESPDPRDAVLTGEPEVWRGPSGQIDLLMPKEVLAWMGERWWEPAHDAWHNVRRCVTGGRGLRRAAECDVPALVRPDRECANAVNGYEFLAAHRHMIDGLKQAFPRHADLFAPFPKFPFDATDVPEAYRARFGTGWSQNVKDMARVLDDIEHNLERFPTDGDLGRFMQCNGSGGGVHGALHFKWAVNGSPGNLGNQTINLKNFMFWKLHGWIDQVWARYRAAKKLAADEPAYARIMLDQCREMDALARYKASLPKPGTPTTPSGPKPVESGTFHEQVRPILEQHCSACHSEASPEAALSLGGALSSADIVKNLVNVRSVHGGTFARVAPGAPEQSWLYLKASGKSTTAVCTGADCNLQVMPPVGEVTLSARELETLRAWIAAGAPAPTTRR
ncbi:MAG: hypothetical protein ABW252_22210 [Polyangiales bacterium]